MRVGVVGVNHKSAEISCREAVAKACGKRFSVESGIRQKYFCVVLSTCHRTEIYFSAEDLAAAHSEILNLLREEISFAFEHKLYAYFGSDCFLHLARVTAGLDSVVLAESEIQGQVKLAYEQSCLNISLPSCVHYLFQKSLQLGKKIRSLFFLSSDASLERVLFELAEHFFVGLAQCRILFIGHSEINRKILRFFKRKGIDEISLCTRSLVSAQEFAKSEQIELVGWEELPNWMNYDLVISGTNVSNYLITPTACSVKTRLIFDLGVPRNIDPRVGRSPGVTLLNMEKVGVILEERQRKNQEEISSAELELFTSVHRCLYAFERKQNRREVYAG